MRAALAAALLWAVPVAGAAQAPAAAPKSAPAASPAPLRVPEEVRPGTVHRFLVRPGDKVRFWDPVRGLKGEEGVVVSDALAGVGVVRRGHAEALPFASFERMDVQRGERHPWKGAAIGATLGGLAYVAFGNLFDDNVDWEDKAWQALAATGVGAAAGALVGGLAWHPHWIPVDLSAGKDPARPSARFSPELPRPASPGPRSWVRVSLRF